MTPEKTSHELTLVAAWRQSASASEKESTARAALELLAGRTLSDLEWAGCGRDYWNSCRSSGVGARRIRRVNLHFPRPP